MHFVEILFIKPFNLIYSAQCFVICNNKLQYFFFYIDNVIIVNYSISEIIFLNQKFTSWY